MHIGIDESRSDEAALGIDRRRSNRNLDRSARTGGDNARSFDDNYRVRNRRAAIAVDQRAARDGDSLGQANLSQTGGHSQGKEQSESTRAHKASYLDRS